MRNGKKINKNPGSFSQFNWNPGSFSQFNWNPGSFFQFIKNPGSFFRFNQNPGSFKIPTPFLRSHSTEIFLRIPKTAGFKMDKKPQYVYFYLIPQEPFYLDKSTTGAIFVPQEPPFT